MRNWLAPGEQLIVTSRAQAKSLFWPAVLTILVPMLAGLILAWLSKVSWSAEALPWRTPATLGVLLVAALVLLGYPVRRYLRWLATRYLLTSQRIVIRSGLVRRRHQDVPLHAVRTVDARQGMLQRMLRSGNLALASGVHETIVVHDVPEVMKFKNLVLQAIAELPHSQLGQEPVPPQLPQPLLLSSDKYSDQHWLDDRHSIGEQNSARANSVHQHSGRRERHGKR